MRSDLTLWRKKKVLLEIFDKGDLVLNIILSYKCFLESRKNDKMELKSFY